MNRIAKSAFVLVLLGNATLTNIEGFQAPKADLTITVDRAEFNRVMMSQAGFEKLEEEGKARLDGDRTVIAKLRDMMVNLHPDFEILPGTAPSERQVPSGCSFALPEGATLIDTD